MKLTILGGGGFRVPLVYRALMNDQASERVDEVRLYDVDPARLASVARVLEGLGADHPHAPRVVATTELPTALRGADFVFSAIRVGGTRGRALDEQLCLSRHLLGQETVGAGGISYALRGIPVARQLVDAISEFAPTAWTINFTNPAGVITQVMREGLGERVIGICDSPVGLARRGLQALRQANLLDADTTGISIGDPRVHIDYLGLNHLGWVRGIEIDGVNVLPRLLERAELIESFEEGCLFGAPLIQALGAIPNEYLNYYYFARETLTADQAAGQPRGQFLERQQARFYDAIKATTEPVRALEMWEQTRLERERTYMATNREALGVGERDHNDLESGGYDQVALAIMHAIANDARAELILNVANHGVIAELADEDVIEMPCLVDGSGVHRLDPEPLADYAKGLVVTVKGAENFTIAAVREQSVELARMALLHHPLVDSWNLAGELLADLMNQFDQLAYLK